MKRKKKRGRPLSTLKNHLQPDELRALARKTTNPVERYRWRALWLLSKGDHPLKVAKLLERSDRWVRKTLNLYNQKGPEGLRDRRRDNPGRKPLLSPSIQEELRQVLREGDWTIHTVAEWLSARVGRKVSYNTAWMWLRRLEITLPHTRKGRRFGKEKAR